MQPTFKLKISLLVLLWGTLATRAEAVPYSETKPDFTTGVATQSTSGSIFLYTSTRASVGSPNIRLLGPTGQVFAPYFIGDGSGLTGLPCHPGTGLDSILCQGSGNVAAATFSVATGGQDNQIGVNAAYSFVGGGNANSATFYYDIIVGGYGNSVTGYDSIIVGGGNNFAQGIEDFIGGGYNNHISTSTGLGDDSSIVGGLFNTVHAQDSVITGGAQNTLDGNNSIIGAGATNNITSGGFDGGIVAGTNNTLSNDGSFIGSGNDNTVSGEYSSIAGGFSNTASGDTAFIGGGLSNTASGTYATIPGGLSNTASGNYSVAIGRNAKATSDGSVVISDSQGIDFTDNGTNTFNARFAGGVFFPSNVFVGGSTLTVNGPIVSTGTVGGVVFTGAGTRFEWIPHLKALRAGSVTGTQWNTSSIGTGSIAFGTDNRASDTGATVSGGDTNSADGGYSVIGGGQSNVLTSANGAYSVISGGYNNWSDGGYVSIGGGSNNTVSANNQPSLSTIAGGSGNFINLTGGFDTGGSIGGGVSNTVSGIYATVSGGLSNTASGNRSIVGGGTTNVASGTRSIAGGGGNNLSSGTNATVSGGRFNTASGTDSTVPGGEGNVSAGDYSFAAGRAATATAQGSFVWADSSTSGLRGKTTDQFLVKAQGGFDIITSSLSVVGTAQTLFTVDGTSTQTKVPLYASAIGNTTYSLTTSSGISTSNGGVTAPWFSGSFYGDGSGITNVTATDNTKVAKAGDTMTGDLQIGGVTASTFSASGYITLANLTISPSASQGRLYFDSASGLLKISVDGVSFVALATSTTGGSISAVVSNAAQFSGDGTGENPLTLRSSSVTLQGNAFNGVNQLTQLDTNGNLTLPYAVSATTENLSGTGNTTYSLTTSSGISVAAGGVTAPWFSGSYYGNGTGLTNVSPSGTASGDLSGTYPSPKVIAASASGGLAVTYGISAGSASITNGLTASSGTFKATGANVYSLTTSSGITVSNAGVTAPWFSGSMYGNGAGLTNLPASTPTGSAGGDLSGSYPNPSVASASLASGLSITYGVSAGSATIAGGLTASSGTFTASGASQFSIKASSGILLGLNDPLCWGNGTNCMYAPASGSGTLSGSGTTNTITKFTGTTSVGNSSITDDGTTTTLAETTNLTAIGNTTYSLTTSSGVSVSAGGVAAPYFIGDGAQLTNIAGGNVSGNISGNAANVSGTILTSHGGSGQTTTPGNGGLFIGNATTSMSTGTLGGNAAIAVSNSAGAINLSLNSSSVTLQGNAFNGNSQLMQTTSDGKVPALSGANLTNLNGTNITAGTVSSARLPTDVAYTDTDNSWSHAQTSASSWTITASGATQASLKLSSGAVVGGPIVLGSGAFIQYFDGSTSTTAATGSGSGGSTTNNILTSFAQDNFLGQVNGSQTSFTLSQAPATSSGVWVALDGLMLSGTSDYTFTPPATITLTTAPASNSSNFFAIYGINTTTQPAAALQNSANAFTAANTFADQLSALSTFTVTNTTVSINGVVYHFPANGGSNKQVLQTNGANPAILSWATLPISSSSVVGSSATVNTSFRGCIPASTMTFTSNGGSVQHLAYYGHAKGIGGSNVEPIIWFIVDGNFVNSATVSAANCTLAITASSDVNSACRIPLSVALSSGSHTVCLGVGTNVAANSVTVGGTVTGITDSDVEYQEP